jgi:hypothetical protein
VVVVVELGREDNQALLVVLAVVVQETIKQLMHLINLQHQVLVLLVMETQAQAILVTLMAVVAVELVALELTVLETQVVQEEVVVKVLLMVLTITGPVAVEVKLGIPKALVALVV